MTAPCRLLVTAVLVAGLLPAAPAVAAPKVIVSVKPVHSLVSMVMEGVADPHLLVDGATSPHSYSLRPSDARRLASADIIFWVGPALEGFLEKPLRTLGRRATKVTLMKRRGLRLHRTREGGIWEGHDDHDHGGQQGGHKHGGHKHGGHKHGGHKHAAGHDGHIWLDPRNGIAIVRVAARVLAGRDPANAARYRANAARAVARLRVLDTRLRRQVAPVRPRPFVVFHDAYQYFERRYGLAAAGSITLDGNQTPSARRLYQVRSRILKGGVRCVFIEPQFPARLARTVVEGTPAKVATLDPLGANLPAGSGAYETLLTNLAASLTNCLR